MGRLPERIPVAIVGGGQAGLTMSRRLLDHGVEHVVLERSHAFHSWREERWDAFTLVTPNFQCRLPGYPYAGPEPDGFMVKSEILDYLGGFRASFPCPLFEGVEVLRLSWSQDAFVLRTSAGPLRAEQVVLAVGGYHRPWAPRWDVPESVVQRHSSSYRCAAQLPPGAVLVVGTGQSGAQIAEDLHLAGRHVHLCVGDAPRCARVYRGRDVVRWLQDMGHYDLAFEDHPDGNLARREANHYVTGRDGGRDLDLRAFAREGMILHGRLRGIEDGVAAFADDLRERLDRADATYNRINAGIDRWIAEQDIATGEGPSVYRPVWQPGHGAPRPLALREAEVSAIVWCTGFRPDWSWVQVPFLDDDGDPDHDRGVARRTPGLHVLGLPWLHTWGSGRFAGIDRDALHLAEQIVTAVMAR
ncbi:MAG TPA: MSMEG_0569 family flavin-dependent oxidoreductase [Solirubrobacteraceae bacterium]|jgi:putative flavoprotein involved in K+ transport|nr:MSMEG_0569 family flavin-dependent oxidoreductase [Solirubrobacteraceae bacterium]